MPRWLYILIGIIALLVILMLLGWRARLSVYQVADADHIAHVSKMAMERVR